jgi:hypothetical protein
MMKSRIMITNKFDSSIIIELEPTPLQYVLKTGEAIEITNSYLDAMMDVRLGQLPDGRMYITIWPENLTGVRIEKNGIDVFDYSSMNE